jgi:hypothetical protein
MSSIFSKSKSQNNNNNNNNTIDNKNQHSYSWKRTHRDFILPWQNTDTQLYFLEHKDKIGERLSAHDLFNIELGENHDARRKRKWKELKHISEI